MEILFTIFVPILGAIGYALWKVFLFNVLPKKAKEYDDRNRHKYK